MCILTTLFIFPAVAGAIDVNPGDFVKLIERDIDIPIHPAAGDTGVSLRIASWNMANLHSKNGKSVYAGTRPSEMHFNIDYERIKCFVRMFDPDIADREVD